MSIQIIQGDVCERLADLPENSVDCVVTSPPYWGLRDYGVDGQIGLEPTLSEHIEKMVNVFRDVRRVMKPSATLWLNYGDCYATSPNGRSAAATKAAGGDDRTFRDKPFSTIQGVLKAKDLCMVPNRLAIALQEDGWWVRSEIIWAKPNPMPESITDRPATAHEKIFLLSKSAKYFYDAEAVREKSSSCPDNWKNPDGWDTDPGSHGNIHRLGRSKGKPAKEKKKRGSGRPHAGFDARWDNMSRKEQQENGRNCRNVWTIATKPFSAAHFATFPPELAARCIKAGCPVGGVVLNPFGGAGTTGLVADQLQRDAILIELNPEYVEIAQRRIAENAGMFSAVEVA